MVAPTAVVRTADETAPLYPFFEGQKFPKSSLSQPLHSSKSSLSTPSHVKAALLQSMHAWVIGAVWPVGFAPEPDVITAPGGRGMMTAALP